MKRLLSAPAFQFKGTGWYVTDYAKKNSASPGGSQSGEESSESGPKGSGESKAATKKEESSESPPKKTPASSEGST